VGGFDYEKDRIDGWAEKKIQKKKKKGFMAGTISFQSRVEKRFERTTEESSGTSDKNSLGKKITKKTKSQQDQNCP